MLQLARWQSRQRQRPGYGWQFVQKIHLSALAPLIIETEATLMVILCHDVAVNCARLNEVFDLKQKAFSHARAVFSHCRHPSLDKFVQHVCGHEIRWSNNVYVCYVQGVTLPHCTYLDIYISQTAVDLTIPANKSKENEYDRYKFLIKKLKLAFQITFAQTDFL